MIRQLYNCILQKTSKIYLNITKICDYYEYFYNYDEQYINKQLTLLNFVINIKENHDIIDCLKNEDNFYDIKNIDIYKNMEKEKIEKINLQKNNNISIILSKKLFTDFYNSLTNNLNFNVEQMLCYSNDIVYFWYFYTLLFCYMYICEYKNNKDIVDFLLEQLITIKCLDDVVIKRQTIINNTKILFFKNANY
jgi:hypothetical protein